MVYRHKSRPSGQELRELLIDAALESVEDSGADALSATAVCRMVGASDTASYTHFPDGATELLAAVAARGFERLQVSLVKSPKATDAEERVREVFRRYVGFGLKFPHLYRAMFSPRLAEKLGAVNLAAERARRGARTYTDLIQVKASAFEAFVDPVQTLQRASALRSSQRSDAAKAIATLAHGLVLEFIDEGIGHQSSRGNARMTEGLALASRLIEMLLQGVLADRSAKGSGQ